MSKLDDYISDQELDDFVSDVNPAQAYLNSLKKSGRKSQDHALRTIAKMMKYEHWSDVPWHKLTYLHTRKIQNELIQSKYAPRTVQRMMAALKRVLKEAWRQGLMTAEDYKRATDLEKIRGGGELTGRMLSQEEIRRFYHSCLDGSAKGFRDAAIFAILRLGLRISETVRLTMADLYFDNETLITIKVIGKGSKIRFIPIEGEIREALTNWLAVRGYQSGSFFQAIGKDDVIVKRGLSYMGLYTMLSSRQEKLAMQKFSPHDMRRTMISELLEYSDVSVVQGLAGHQSPIHTIRYDRRPTDARREAVKYLSLR